MRTIKSRQLVIHNGSQRFVRAMETNDFIYFIDENEGDENANTLMYNRETLKLVSNNYFANQSLFEDIKDEKQVKVSKSFEYNYAEILKNIEHD